MTDGARRAPVIEPVPQPPAVQNQSDPTTVASGVDGARPFPKRSVPGDQGPQHPRQAELSGLKRRAGW